MARDWSGQAGVRNWADHSLSLVAPVERLILSGAVPGETVVISLGWILSAYRSGGAADFFQNSVVAAESLGRRAILLTPNLDQVPAKLPPGIVHMGFVSHWRLLPRSAAVVHHGGTGSLAAGLEAGAPQLICRDVGDESSNARRLLRLGVAESIAPRNYRPDAARAALERLLTSPRVAAACARFSEGCCKVKTLKRIADQVEMLWQASENPGYRATPTDQVLDNITTFLFH